MPKILSSIACNLDRYILQAAIPLFESEKVQAIEWSFDTLFNKPHIPTWFTELLHAFSNENRLIGHGVFFSLFSGKWSKEQQNWLNHFFTPLRFSLNKKPIEDRALAEQQRQLSQILENATSYADAKAQLAVSDLAHSDWEIEKWAPYMLETAMQIAQKWQSRD